MADNVTLPGTGAVISTDDIGGGVEVQRVKVQYGADGSATDVDTGTGLPTTAGYKEVTGTAAANNTDVINLDVRGYQWVSVQLTGTFSATVTFQASNDNSTWQNVSLVNLANLNAATASAKTATTSGNLYMGGIYGRYFRVRVTAYTSGTVGVTAEFSARLGTGGVVAQIDTSAGTPAVSLSGNATLNGSNVNAADAATNSNAASVFAFLGGYNGASWDRLRTPAIFKTATATASGDTALWTPAAGKKFRLQCFMIQVTQDAAQSSGGDIDVVLRDSATATAAAFSVYVPGTAGTTFGSGASSGWVDLGNGLLSAAANNVLNINLSAALTAGKVRVVCCGTEE